MTNDSTVIITIIINITIIRHHVYFRQLGLGRGNSIVLECWTLEQEIPSSNPGQCQTSDCSIRQPDSVGTTLSFSAVIFTTHYSQQYSAEDAHRTYTRGLVLGEALKRNSEISLTHPLIFTAVKKC